MIEATMPTALRLVRLPLRLAAASANWFFGRLLVWQQRAEERAQLAAMDQRMLKDIGISRADAEHEAMKAPWQP
jgi:uncharacterized protein YjiS (DUF1127 family)